ncbi:hypothetical protein BIY23_02155 [Wolbachia pipientis]|uniref:Uncharacterized protein n=1 Tax=Wolbachia pipientis TaxID=955 RepID=A0A1E7QK20_WOLPI|nr:hypothetical protein [Wolbachia pipientis]OEY86811.1 hypothetical protein BIY23_02155 [Wolbachia pipientis]
MINMRDYKERLRAIVLHPEPKCGEMLGGDYVNYDLLGQDILYIVHQNSYDNLAKRLNNYFYNIIRCGSVTRELTDCNVRKLQCSKNSNEIGI